MQVQQQWVVRELTAGAELLLCLATQTRPTLLLQFSRHGLHEDVALHLHAAQCDRTPRISIR